MDEARDCYRYLTTSGCLCLASGSQRARGTRTLSLSVTDVGYWFVFVFCFCLLFPPFLLRGLIRASTFTLSIRGLSALDDGKWQPLFHFFRADSGGTRRRVMAGASLLLTLLSAGGNI